MILICELTEKRIDTYAYVDELAANGLTEIKLIETIGIIENGQKEILEKMNSKLLSYTRVNPQRFHFLDTEKVLANHGKNRCSNEKMRYLAKMIIPDKALPFLANEIMRFIRPITGQTKKCLVLALDDTLWGGVLGEEGLEGIKLGDDAPPEMLFGNSRKR